MRIQEIEYLTFGHFKGVRGVRGEGEETYIHVDEKLKGKNR
jgi:hypothetical protein